MFEQMRCSHVCVIFFTVLEVVLGITLRFVETLLLCFWAQRGRTRWGRSRCLDAPQAAEPRLCEASGEQRSSQDKTRRQQSSGRRRSGAAMESRRRVKGGSRTSAVNIQTIWKILCLRRRVSLKAAIFTPTGKESRSFCVTVTAFPLNYKKGRRVLRCVTLL